VFIDWCIGRDDPIVAAAMSSTCVGMLSVTSALDTPRLTSWLAIADVDITTLIVNK
jgi:hypothetical protein